MLGKPLEGRARISNFDIEVSHLDDGLILYRRSCVGECEGHNIIRKVVSSSMTIVPYPMYPIYYPRFVTRHILCVLEDELVLAPRDSRMFYLKVPYDVAVYARANSEFRVLDVVPLHSRYKLSFYGHHTGGIIARVCRSRVYVEEPQPDKGLAVMPVSIVNDVGKVMVISRILLDSSPLKLYYKPGSWSVYTQLIQLNISTQNVAMVNYGDVPWRGLEAIDDPPEIRPPKIAGTTYMLWGF